MLEKGLAVPQVKFPASFVDLPEEFTDAVRVQAGPCWRLGHKPPHFLLVGFENQVPAPL